MTDNVIRREVQRRDDPFGIPSCFYWTVDEVADWIDSIGYGKYKENFRSHFINGRKLLTVDACVLPRLGITNFGDILDISKHIREVLGIRRHLSGYNAYQPRNRYIQPWPTSGKKHPALTYRQLAIVKGDPVAEARLNYFKMRGICYTGWTMEHGWDRQIRAEEHHIREEMKKAGLPFDRSQKLIGSSMQERLKEASRRLLSYDEEPRFWHPEPGKSFRAFKKRVRDPKLEEPPKENNTGTGIIGQVNWTHVRDIPYETKLYESGEKGAKDKHDGAKKIDKEKPEVPTIEIAKHEEQSMVKETGGKGQVTVEEPTNNTKKERRSIISTSTDYTKFDPKQKKSKPYSVAAVFHWQPMERTKGYPPLRLDKLKKCGYYYGEDR